MHRYAVLAVLSCVTFASAQAPTMEPATEPLLSPQAAYDQANSPVDIIRRDTGNWSELELKALEVAIAQANAACEARRQVPYSESDLVGYARLCSLGKNWQPAYTAATAYINSDAELKPLLTDAYALQIQADFNLKREHEGVGACLAMLRSVPYGVATDDIVTAAIRYLELAYTDDAITVAAERQQHLLELLRDEKESVQPRSGGQIPVHTLLVHALEFAAIEQYENEPDTASTTVLQIQSEMPRALSPDESILVDEAWKQYALIGTKFPDLPGAVTLMQSTGPKAAQPKFGSATVFLLFPGWCAQCVREAKQIVPALLRTAVLKGPGDDSDVHIYALLADEMPAPKPVTSGAATRSKLASKVAPSEPEKDKAPTPIDRNV